MERVVIALWIALVCVASGLEGEPTPIVSASDKLRLRLHSVQQRNQDVLDNVIASETLMKLPQFNDEGNVVLPRFVEKEPTEMSFNSKERAIDVNVHLILLHSTSSQSLNSPFNESKAMQLFKQTAKIWSYLAHIEFHTKRVETHSVSVPLAVQYESEEWKNWTTARKCDLIHSIIEPDDNDLYIAFVDNLRIAARGLTCKRIVVMSSNIKPAILAHEIGHALSLSEELGTTESLMNGLQHDIALSDSDREKARISAKNLNKPPSFSSHLQSNSPQNPHEDADLSATVMEHNDEMLRIRTQVFICRSNFSLSINTQNTEEEANTLFIQVNQLFKNLARIDLSAKADWADINDGAAKMYSSEVWASGSHSEKCQFIRDVMFEGKAHLHTMLTVAFVHKIPNDRKRVEAINCPNQNLIMVSETASPLTIAHQIGHVLGLPSSARESIMNEYSPSMNLPELDRRVLRAAALKFENMRHAIHEVEMSEREQQQETEQKNAMEEVMDAHRRRLRKAELAAEATYAVGLAKQEEGQKRAAQLAAAATKARVKQAEQYVKMATESQNEEMKKRTQIQDILNKAKAAEAAADESKGKKHSAVKRRFEEMLTRHEQSQLLHNLREELTHCPTAHLDLKYYSFFTNADLYKYISASGIGGGIVAQDPNSQSEKREATFLVVPGLSDSLAGISFESMARPGEYLRVDDKSPLSRLIVSRRRDAATNQFDALATFRLHKGLRDCHQSFVSIRPMVDPYKFVVVENGAMRVAYLSQPKQLAAASFRFVNPQAELFNLIIKDPTVVTKGRSYTIPEPSDLELAAAAAAGIDTIHQQQEELGVEVPLEDIKTAETVDALQSPVSTTENSETGREDGMSLAAEEKQLSKLKEDEELTRQERQSAAERSQADQVKSDSIIKPLPEKSPEDKEKEKEEEEAQESNEHEAEANKEAMEESNDRLNAAKEREAAATKDLKLAETRVAHAVTEQKELTADQKQQPEKTNAQQQNEDAAKRAEVKGAKEAADFQAKQNKHIRQELLKESNQKKTDIAKSEAKKNPLAEAALLQITSSSSSSSSSSPAAVSGVVGGYCLMMWVKPIAIVNEWSNIVHRGTVRYQHTPSLWFHPKSTKLRIVVSTADNFHVRRDPDVDLPLKRWSHVAVCHSQEGRLQVHVNGDKMVSAQIGSAFTPPMAIKLTGTQANGKYAKFYALAEANLRSGSTVVAIRAKSNVQIALSENDDVGDPRNSYEIVINGDGAESGCGIRSSRNKGLDIMKNIPNLLTESEYRFFWLAWTNGKVQIGRGQRPGENLLISLDDNSAPRDVKFIGITTANGIDGQFKLSCVSNPLYISDPWQSPAKALISQVRYYRRMPTDDEVAEIVKLQEHGENEEIERSLLPPPTASPTRAPTPPPTPKPVVTQKPKPPHPTAHPNQPLEKKYSIRRGKRIVVTRNNKVGWTAAECARIRLTKDSQVSCLPPSAERSKHGYTVMFWIQPHDSVEDWSNVLHFGDVDGDRLPGVWFAPKSLNLVVHSSTASDPHAGMTTSDPPIGLTKGEWIHIAIQHNKLGELRVFKNGNIAFEKFVKEPPKQADGSLWISNSWHLSAIAELADVRIYDMVTKLSTIKEAMKQRLLGTASDEENPENANAEPIVIDSGKRFYLRKNNNVASADTFSDAFKSRLSSSIAMWIRPDSISKEWANIMTFGNDKKTRQPSMYFMPGTTSLRIDQATVAVWDNAVTSSKHLPLHEWSHVAVSCAHNGELKVYINGHLDNTTFIDGAPLFKKDQDLYLADDFHTSANAEVADVRLYPRVISGNEALQLFEKRQIAEDRDSSPIFIHQGSKFAPLKDDVVCKDEMIYTGDGYSLMGWIQPVEEVMTQWSNLFQRGGSQLLRQPAMFFQPTSFLPTIYSNGVNNKEGRLDLSTPLTALQYSHIAIIHTDDHKGDGELKVYVNGKLSKTARIGSPALGSTNDTVFYGSNPWNEPAKALISDMRWYHRALTESQIQDVIAEHRFDKSDEHSKASATPAKQQKRPHRQRPHPTKASQRRKFPRRVSPSSRLATKMQIKTKTPIATTTTTTPNKRTTTTTTTTTANMPQNKRL